MNCEILSVGTELLLGDIVNTDAQYLARELAAMGISVYYQTTVGDNEERLSEAVKQALSRSDILIVSGGLGPTEDDLTKEVVCHTMGAELVLHDESHRRICDYFKRSGKKMDPSNIKQAMLPKGGIIFPNNCGTAPGCAVTADGKTAIMLPGPPRELQPMFQNHVKPFLNRFSDKIFVSHNIHVFGVSEAAMASGVKDLMDAANPTVAPYAKDGECRLRITASGKNEAECEALAAPVIEEICCRLGSAVYGIDCGSLQAKAVELLAKRGLRVATAESCTAGLLAKRITEVAGSSDVFECGIVSYANRIKEKLLGVAGETLSEHGAVSPQTAAEMAHGALKAGGADIGIGITGIAGPGGGTAEKPVGLIYIALCNEKQSWVRKLQTGHTGSGEREYNRFTAASTALNMLRRYLEQYPELSEDVQL